MSPTIDTDAATESIWQHLQRGRHYPTEWGGKLDMRQGYLVQLGILQRYVARGERHAGWKVGLTAAAMRAQHNVHEPCFGFLLESGNKLSGHVFRHAELIQPGFENEICITLGETLQGPGITFEQARRAIREIAPALEIVEKRGNFSADLPLTMADNAQQKAFVTGAAVRLGDIDLAQASVTVYVDDAVRDRATGAEVMGNPINSIVWLANKLSEFGRALEAGQRVISGSFTRQHALEAPARVRSVFEPVGTVEAMFA